jgi:hypothetical protein
MSNSIRFCWATLELRVQHDRVECGSPETLEHFEWLAGVMAELDRKAGRTVTYDQERLAHERPEHIREVDRAIRMDEELRAVIVRPMSTATLEPDPAPLEAA